MQLAGSDAPFDAPVEFEIVAPEQRQLVESFLSVSLDDNLPAPPPGNLRFLLKLEPLCAFKAAVELAVNRPNLGRWRFKLDLVGSDADPDDTIVIESSIGKTASVSFVLQGVADVAEPCDSPPALMHCKYVTLCAGTKRVCPRRAATLSL